MNNRSQINNKEIFQHSRQWLNCIAYCCNLFAMLQQYFTVNRTQFNKLHQSRSNSWTLSANLLGSNPLSSIEPHKKNSPILIYDTVRLFWAKIVSKRNIHVASKINIKSYRITSYSTELFVSLISNNWSHWL